MSRTAEAYQEALEAGELADPSREEMEGMSFDPATEKLDAYLDSLDAAWDADCCYGDAKAVQALRDSLEVRARLHRCMYPQHYLPAKEDHV